MVNAYKRRLTRLELEALLLDPLARKIVSKLIIECFRTGWSVEGIDGIDHEQMISDLEDLKLEQAIVKTIEYGNTYGGGILLGQVSDGKPSTESVSMKDIRGLYTFHAIPSYQVMPGAKDVEPTSPSFQEILTYDIYNFIPDISCAGVHRSRVRVYEPNPLPPDYAGPLSPDSPNFGPGLLESCHDALMSYGAASQYSLDALFQASILMTKMKQYRENVLTDEGRNLIIESLRTLRTGMDAYGILAMDSEDDLIVHNLTNSAIPDVLGNAKERLIASQWMPKEIFWNETPSGLNAGELSGPQQILHSTADAFRESVLSPMLDWALSLYFASKGIFPEKWKIVWEPLWQETHESKTRRREANANIDDKYLRMGSIEPDEIRQQRFVEGDEGPLRVSAPNTSIQAPGLASEEDVEAYTASRQTSILSPEETPLMLDILERFNSGKIAYTGAATALRLLSPSLASEIPNLLGPQPLPSAPLEDAPAEIKPMPQDLATPSELAALGQISSAALHRMRKNGIIQGYQFGQNTWRYSKAEVAEAIRRGQSNGDEEG